MVKYNDTIIEKKYSGRSRASLVRTKQGAGVEPICTPNTINLHGAEMEAENEKTLWLTHKYNDDEPVSYAVGSLATPSDNNKYFSAFRSRDGNGAAFVMSSLVDIPQQSDVLQIAGISIDGSATIYGDKHQVTNASIIIPGFTPEGGLDLLETEPGAKAVPEQNTLTFMKTPGVNPSDDAFNFLFPYVLDDHITIFSCAYIPRAEVIEVHRSVVVRDMHKALDFGDECITSRIVVDGVTHDFRFNGSNNIDFYDMLSYIRFGYVPTNRPHYSDVIADSQLADQASHFALFRTNVDKFNGNNNLQGFLPNGLTWDLTIYAADETTPVADMEEYGYHTDTFRPDYGYIMLPYVNDPDNTARNLINDRTVTFVRNPVPGCADMFDLIVDATGDSYRLASDFANEVTLVNADTYDGPIIPDEETVSPDIEPFMFTSVDNSSVDKISEFTISMSSIVGYWEVREAGQVIASPNHRASGVSFERDTDAYTTIIIDNMSRVARSFEVYAKAQYVAIDYESSYMPAGDLEVTVTSFGSSFDGMIVRTGRGIIHVPDTLPPHMTRCANMFNNNHDVATDITGWDTSHVTEMDGMFMDCKVFNQDISGWDVGNVTNMGSMFFGAREFNRDLSKWCVTNIDSYPLNFARDTDAWMLPKPVWGTCPEEEVILPEDAFVVELTKYRNGYYSASNSEVGIVRTAVSGSDWQLHNILTGELLCDQDGIYNTNVIHNDNSDDTTYIKLPSNEKMVVGMSGEFTGVKMYVGAAERYSDDMTIYGAVNILKYPNEVSSIEHAIEGYELTIPHDLPSGLTTLNNYFKDSNLFNQDISHWDISAINSTDSMFYSAKSFNQDISKWDVSNVRSMITMFTSAQSFNQDLSGWCVKHIDGPGYNWNYNTPSWTLPKPVWGTCPAALPDTPDYDPAALEFELTGMGGIVLKLWYPQEDWKLYRDDTLLLSHSINDVTNANWIGDLDELYINITNNTASTSKYVLESNTLGIRVDEVRPGNTPVPKIRVVTFPTNFRDNSYGFAAKVNTTEIILPETLPAEYTDISYMLTECTSFNQDISMWDTSNVVNMEELFSGATSFNQDISSWDTSNVTNMDAMFKDASAFNQDLSSWDVSNIESKPYDFDTNAGTWTLPRPIWGASSGALPTRRFEFTIEANDITPTNDRWRIHYPDGQPASYDVYRNGEHVASSDDADVLHVTDSYGNVEIYVPQNETYHFAIVTTAAALKIEYYTELISNPNKITITRFSEDVDRYEFRILNAHLEVPRTLPEHIRSMYSMFADSNLFNQDLSGWDVSRITDTQHAFSNCEAFNGDISNWSLDSLTNATKMFYGCKSFNVPIGNWRTPNLTVAVGMFQRCEIFNQDLSNWDVSNVFTFEDMFSQCYAFNGSLSGWDITGATTTKGMFSYAHSFNQDIGMWDTSRLKTMEKMFQEAKAFNQDISMWDTSSITGTTGMSGMFNYASSFNQDLSGWNVSNVSDRPYIFDSSATSWTLPRPVWGTAGSV